MVFAEVEPAQQARWRGDAGRRWTHRAGGIREGQRFGGKKVSASQRARGRLVLDGVRGGVGGSWEWLRGGGGGGLEYFESGRRWFRAGGCTH